jgi:hypothetical protein
MKSEKICKRLLVWSIILAIPLTIFLPSLPVSAASPAVVTVSVPAQPVSHGQQFTVNIVMQPNNAIAGAQFSLSFNPSLVSINSVTEGNLFNQGGANTYFMAGTINNAAGTLTNVGGAIITPGQTVSTTGTFAVITMTASSSSGTCPLSLSNVVAGDINGNSISINIVNGQVINSPPTITTSSLPAWTAGVAYSQTLAAAGGTSPYTWSIASGPLPAGLLLSSGGVISGIPAAAGGPTSVTFQVTDSTSAIATKSLSITINTTPSINTSLLPNGTVGAAYSQTLAVIGGTTPYAWSLSSGTLPAGLSLSSSGTISGTPTTAGGPTSVIFRVTDSTGAAVTKSLSITINIPLSIGTSSLPNGTVGVTYSQTLSPTGGSSPYIWSAVSGTLPVGLSLNSAGVISGIPTAAGGPTSVTFRVTDSTSATATKSLSITVAYAGWDVNADGSVNVLDLVLVAQHSGETGSAGWEREDVNADGTVNILDLILIGQHWTG